MQTIGIDIGYTSVKTVILDASGGVVHTSYTLHKGHGIRELARLVREILRQPETAGITYGAVTGSGASLLSKFGDFHQVNEVAALVEGALFLDGSSSSILEMGGQTAKYITGFSPEDKSNVQVSMTSNCSAGTGSFLEEQVSRLGVGIEEYSELAANAASVPRIAGRCSVFAKTDITHHQQEGVPVADILAGLAHAVVRNYRGAVMRGLPRTPPFFFAGGVARNRTIREAMKTVLGFDEDQLHVHEHADKAAAFGAALLAAEQRLPLDLIAVVGIKDKAGAAGLHRQDAVRLEPLLGFGKGDAEGKHDCPRPHAAAKPVDAWLGIDVGSTSTNVVLSDGDDHILQHLYLRTAGDPNRAVRSALQQMIQIINGNIRVAGVGVTGSGRHMIGRLVGADLVRDEITAQARAAVAMDPEVDTIFEIGGQDSKFIALKNGVVTDFQMNKICAAGTGSFIEEQAKKLGLTLDEIGPNALAASSPISLGERCTVFMESSIAAHLSQGADIAELAAGLCYSIVKNYLNRVVSNKRVGRKVFLQGGVAHNQGVVNAFRSVTGKKVMVPPFFSVTGAYGAAILTRETMAAEHRSDTVFKGFYPPDIPRANSSAAVPSPTGSAFNKELQAFIFRDYDPTIDPSRKTVGIPRALFTFGMFPMFYPFFKALGCNVILSEPTSEKTVRLAQEYSLDETCYPVKLINGHAAELVEKGVDFLFFPDLYTVSHPGSLSRQNYGCPYMQAAFKIINKAMDLKSKGIKLLAPTIAFNQGKKFMHKVFMDMGWEVGGNKEQTMLALTTAMQSFKDFEARMEKRGKDLKDLVPGRKTFVLISKIYGVADPVLNLGIPDKLAEMGYQTLPFYALPEVGIFDQNPNMYWPFGQHILEAAKQVAAHPDLHAIFLTHHGCGPDTVTAHYFREIMGDKPYLTIEVDEHSSGVGVITRVEAFVNSLERQGAGKAPARESKTKPVAISSSIKRRDGTLLLPNLYPYSQLFAESMRRRGHDVTLFNASTMASVDFGRRHTVTNEYFSLVALLGDMLHTLRLPHILPNRSTVVLPQNEGAEVDGQYARFLRAKLDETGYDGVGICAPFLEDLLDMDRDHLDSIFLCLVAGDLVMLTPPAHRKYVLETILENERNGNLDRCLLTSIARHIHTWNATPDTGKRVFVLGEPLVMFNDFLNDGTFKRMEANGHRVVLAPLSEYLWSFWRDHLALDNGLNRKNRSCRLCDLQRLIRIISEELGPQTHFAPDLESLMLEADRGLGYYTGAFGRYRSVKAGSLPPGPDGIISVSSMYENTGISLEILRNGSDGGLPHLHLTFDGNPNANDRIKTESFLHYL
ncbi:acyl-CoA dehydratase activase [Pseudodesulfovibrio sediminis]|uniref:Activase n=1 Tax=Pseudodesulfovibrio sediminis TaxID=2810563 RepID=A0ABM8HWN9_9BACT|nr:acyl-CoA dehydratase activase [Pseudodesulfovibrio sediminis]BCS88121.1 activase [Pseudodesulfovibrio sediminis]